MSLKEKLAARLHGSITMMGIGNPERSDDAAGSVAVRRMRSRPGLCVIDAQDVPENYLGQVVAARPDTVALMDAVDLGAAPGSVAIVEKDQLAEYWPSTHRVPLCLLINYLERETRADVFLLAIQPRRIEFGIAVSDEVEAAVSRLVSILNDLQALPRPMQMTTQDIRPCPPVISPIFKEAPVR
jgi:hydrogenase 3 maturation protease